jgi:hypothetical protein
VPMTTHPLTQNLNTGGQVHCLTQEHFGDIDLDEINRKLREYPELFGGVDAVLH